MLRHGERVLSEYAVQNLGVEHDLEDKSTHVTFSTANVPMTELTLVTDDANFSRTCRLEVRNKEKDAWQHVASGKLSRVLAGRFSQENLDIVLPAAKRDRFYRLTIRNDDSPPLDITGARIRGEIHEALFFTKPDIDLRLHYGADGMRTPPSMT